MPKGKTKLTARWGGPYRPRAMAFKVDGFGTKWTASYAIGRDMSMPVAALLLRCSVMAVHSRAKRGVLRYGTHGKTSVTYGSVKALALKSGIIKKPKQEPREYIDWGY